MGKPSRRHWQAFWLCWITIAAFAMPALASAPGLHVSRLDADPVALQVLSGKFDQDFVAVESPIIDEGNSSPRWWRVVADHDIPATGAPQLLLQSPGFNSVEVWLPGRAMPIRRSLLGPSADGRFSTRALVVPLVGGLDAGQPIYLRVQARGLAPMAVSIQPLAAVHRRDLTHVAWRATALTALLVLAVLALGFWAGLGERSYAYLSLTLLAQFCFTASTGGEIRLLPWVAEIVGGDMRVVRLFGLLAIASGVLFLSHYLDLRERQPRLMRVLDGCNVVLVALMLATLVSTADIIATIGNAVLLFVLGAVMVAAVVGARQRQRAAYFLLLAWLPLMTIVALRVGAVQGLWTGPDWLGHAVPAALALSGLIVTIGLSTSLQQLRRDHDVASRQATFDALTGTLTRPAIAQRLKAAVNDAHGTGRPLSVVFFDIDKFKRINDDYGHRVGDGCLRIIALRTRNRLRTYDMIGRWGGDEMIVVLPDTRLGEALGVAENLRSAINCRPLSVDGHMLDASLSLGVAELAAGETPEQLLERADSGLYTSKSGGRDRVTGHDPRVTGNHPRFVATPR